MPFARLNSITLAAGEDNLRCCAVDETARIAYFGCYTSPGKIVKIDLATFTKVGTLTLAVGENNVGDLVIDPTRTYLYALLGLSPARVAKIDIATFAWVATLTLSGGYNLPHGLSIDPVGDYLYTGHSSSTFCIRKVRLSDFTDFAGLGFGGVSQPYNWSVMGSGGTYLLQNCKSTSRIRRITLATFSLLDSLTGYLGGAEGYHGVINTIRGKIFHCASTTPGVCGMIDESSFTEDATLTLAVGENLSSAIAENYDSDYAYVCLYLSPARVIRIRVSTWARVDSITLNAGENNARCCGVERSLGYLYVGTYTTAGRVVKIGIDSAGGGAAQTLPVMGIG